MGEESMTYRIHMKAAALAAASCLSVAGCTSSITTPTTQAANAAASAGASTMPQNRANISGDYIGSVQDGQGGTGAAKATLAQHGPNAGGAIKDKETSQTIVADLSLTIASSNSTSGAMVVDYPPASTGAVCTFSTT